MRVGIRYNESVKWGDACWIDPTFTPVTLKNWLEDHGFVYEKKKLSEWGL